MSFSKRATALVAILLALAGSGCGYALAGRGSFLPDYIRTVGIPQLTNASTFFEVEQILTEKIRTEFIGRGNYTIVPTPAGAHAVLNATITGVTIQPVGFSEQQLATRHLFQMTMNVAFTDTTTNEVLWSNTSLTFREEYDLSRPALGVEGATFLEQERPLFDRISNDVARTVVSAILEAF